MDKPTPSELKQSLITDLSNFSYPCGITDIDYFEENVCRTLANFILDHVDKYYENEDE
jgi:hypothetical protein